MKIENAIRIFVKGYEQKSSLEILRILENVELSDKEKASIVATLSVLMKILFEERAKFISAVKEKRDDVELSGKAAAYADVMRFITANNSTMDPVILVAELVMHMTEEMSKIREDMVEKMEEMLDEND